MVADNVIHHSHAVARSDRPTNGATLWFTGLSGSGKSTIAAAVESALVASGRPAYMLDGDNVRLGLNGDLGFSPQDRTENIRRVAHVASLMADAGVVAIMPIISPYRVARDHARSVHAAMALPFAEIWVSTPVEVCEQRDPKGLYRKARAGELKDFTGIDAPYEAPHAPELVLPAHEQSESVSVAAVLELLRTQAFA